MATTAGDLGLWMYSSREHSLEWLGGAPAVADLFPDPTAPLSRVMPSVHPDDRGALQQLVSSVSARSPWTRLRYLTEHDGWHELAAQTLRIQLGYGGPERIFGVVRDDTKYEKRKKRARAALAADEDGTVTDGADTEAIGSPTVAPSTTYPTTYSDWQNGLLAGNGKQGVIVFGNPRNDTVVFEGVTRIVTDGTKTLSNGQVTVSNASYVLLLSLTQRYNGTYNGGVPAEQEWNKNLLQQKLAGLSTNYQTLLNRHVAKHSAIFNRVSFDLGATPADRAKSTEQLLAEQKSSSTPVPALYERMFYAGRYHLLGSSNETAAPDLLGNWTGDSNVGWDGYYHLDANLNLQISSGNIGNMPEAMAGYFWLNQQWQKDFETNAKKLLGTRGMLTGGNTPNAEGLISNINYDYPYQYVTGGESWLLYPFWEYYETTGDRTRAKRVRRSSEPLHH
ncbi:hypothetical protein ACFVIL_32760 [Streptomyces sp. NPDC127159]|uniref:glycosyl hydrolase family 95 catalytic domain-containing protein n=1 Tax=unclassified Streptomyces TaxID=2593676 RepID=UPI003628EF7B